MWDVVLVVVKRLKYLLVLLVLFNLTCLSLSGLRVGVFLVLRCAATLACSNSVFVVFRQRQPKRVHVEFIAAGAAGVELQFFRFFESFQEGDIAKNLLWLESLQLGAFFGGMFDPCLVQGIAHGVFTAFAQDFGDLKD